MIHPDQPNTSPSDISQLLRIVANDVREFAESGNLPLVRPLHEQLSVIVTAAADVIDVLGKRPAFHRIKRGDTSTWPPDSDHHQVLCLTMDGEWLPPMSGREACKCVLARRMALWITPSEIDP